MDPLVEDFVARRATALEQAYALWATLFVSVAHHVVRELPAAQDCVHDALLRVWRGPNRFSGDRDALRAYLATCVRNEALMALRSNARRGSREERAARLSPIAANDDPVAVVDPVESERLRSALDRLPEEQRAALTLAYYGNKTHVEIAERLGEPLGTIKSRIASAMRKVRTELATPGGSRS
jgi:RNA polymerase sigma-70 factor (ECF subfamily)